MKILLVSLLSGFTLIASAQTVQSNFKTAYSNFANDDDLKHVTIGLYVVNTSTGKPVSEINIQTGLAPASTQKVVTAATAYALLGKDYSYKTQLFYTGNIENGILHGDIIIKGSGDPTLGSWRYEQTKENIVITGFENAISQLGINEITGHVITDEDAWTGEVTPDGWVWQDIGSYYGAGAAALNWHENQYDLYLNSGSKIGSSVTIAGTRPQYVHGVKLKSRATAAAKGSGDNAYIYHPLHADYGFVRGTIPVNENKFEISGAIPNPGKQLALTLEARLKKLPIEEVAKNYPEEITPGKEAIAFYTYQSPALDSISYWFLKKSVNLYGEALLKTLGAKFSQTGSTDSGLKVLKNFWENQGIDGYALNMMDGSGLSPGNRITAKSLVEVLQYAKKQDWFQSYYSGFPVINGIKMKSGSINGVISYTGFIKSKTGAEYVFAFIVNNYDGSGSAMRHKMWKLLDELK